MIGWRLRCVLVAVVVMTLPHNCPAPIIYRPGEGWTYEPVGGEGKWTRNRAKDQLEVAKLAFDKQDYGTALKASRRVVKVWPLSDFASEAQYLVGRCYEAKRKDERAFKEYQKVITKYPKGTNYDDVLQRQSVIASRFLDGQWFKLWGYVPFFPSMDKTSKLYEEIVRNGPYNETGPPAQLNVGTAREKQKDYPKAVKAYLTAADRYQDRPEISSEALFRAGQAYTKQAKRAEYDQSIAGEAINTFSDFRSLYPKDERVSEAQQIEKSLRTEQARGAFDTAKFYEKYHRWQGAIVYYNEVLSSDPESEYAGKARERIEALRPKAEEAAQRKAAAEERWREERRKPTTGELPPDAQPIEKK